MFRRDEMPLLQKAAEDELVRSRLKYSGIAATIFGVLALFAGVMPPTNLVLVGLGALLSFSGLWNLVMVTPAGLLMSAISLLAVGVFNIVDTIFAASTQSVGSGVWPVLGVMQIVWGYGAIGRWRRFRGALSSDIPDTVRARARELLSALRRANPRKEVDVVVFTVGGIRPTVVRLRLAPDAVLALAIGADDVVLATREQVAFEVKREVAFPRVTRGVFRIAGRTWEGSTSRDGAERLSQWLGSAALRQRAA